MKKFFSILFLMFSVFALKAQVTFSPATFTAIDQVTITVDVTGNRDGAMEGQTDAYIWIFSNPSIPDNSPDITKFPKKDGSVNGTWGNSSETAKMTHIGGNKFQFTFKATEMFGLTPSQLKDFGFLVKTKTGSKQTNDFKPFTFEPLIFVPTKFRIFPAKVSQDDVVTVVFDKSLATTINEQRMTPTTATIVVLDEDGNPFGSPLTLAVRSMENNLWGATFIPTRSFPLPASKKLTKFRYTFNGTVLDTNGSPTTVSSMEAEASFSDLK